MSTVTPDPFYSILREASGQPVKPTACVVDGCSGESICDEQLCAEHVDAIVRAVAGTEDEDEFMRAVQS